LPKTSVDDLLAAIRTVGYLKEAVDKQEQSIQSIVARLDRLEARVEGLAVPREKP